MLVTGLFIITFVLQAFEIPSSSMENTLLIGDHVFVNRVQFAPATHWIGPLIPYRDIQRGDIVVFLSPAEPGLYVVKRIIGVPGRSHSFARWRGVIATARNWMSPTSSIDADPGSERLSRQFPGRAALRLQPRVPGLATNFCRNTFEGDDLVVPPNSYFGMGDNRDVSLDSRFWGFIPQENVIGRPMFIYWSFETPPDQYQQTAIGERVGFLAHVVIHFFDETRWRRTLKVVR